MEMPKGGVNELLKSEGGRLYLDKMREVHKLDILQPKNRDGSDNSEFHKVYDKDIKEGLFLKEKNERKGRDMWMESEERKKYK